MKKSESSLLGKALYYLSFRSRSRAEIVSYLEKKKATKEETETVLKKLEELDLIDDDSFATEMVDSQIRKGNGPKRIYFNLLNKGIDKEVIKHQIDRIEDHVWIKSASEIIQRKRSRWVGLEGFKRSNKVYSLLSYRGHHHGVIKAVIDALPDRE